MKTKSSVFFQLMVLIALAGTAVATGFNTGRTAQAQQKNSPRKKITVVGTALHAKAGAVVETPQGAYYIRGKQDWKNLYNKKVKVTGYLETETHRAEDLVDEKGRVAQGFSGTVQYISKASITLAE